MDLVNATKLTGKAKAEKIACYYGDAHKACDTVLAQLGLPPPTCDALVDPWTSNYYLVMPNVSTLHTLNSRNKSISLQVCTSF